MKSVIKIETYNGTEYGATTNSIRSFDGFSKAADRIRDYGHKMTEEDDFFVAVSFTAFDNDNLTHASLGSNHHLVITKSGIRGEFKKL